MPTRWAERARLDFGVGLTVIASALTLVFALAAPYVLNLFWQIADGREILRGHFPATVAYAIDAGPLIHQQWLFEVALAWAALHHGYGLFVLVCAAAACATPVLAYLLVRSIGGSDLAAGIVAVLTLGGRFVGSAIRPETFAVDLFALELLVLTRPRWRWWILVIEVVWANVHASAILGPLAIGVYTCGDALLQRRASAQTRSLLALTLAAFLATALTPDGVRLWGYTYAMTVAPSELRATLEAWRPLWSGGVGGWLVVLPGLLIVLVDLMRRPADRSVWRVGMGWTTLAVVCLALTVQHTRYATFLCIAWAPLLGTSIDRRIHLQRSQRVHPIAWVALIGFCGYACAGIPATLKLATVPSGPWTAAAEIVRRADLHGNAYVAYAWAAFVHEAAPELRMLIDAHADPYPAQVWRDYRVLDQADEPQWREVLARRSIQVLVLPTDAPLARVILNVPGWHELARHDGAVVFTLRSIPSDRR